MKLVNLSLTYFLLSIQSSSFTDDLSSEGKSFCRCPRSPSQVDKKFPALKNCFKETSLYFSTLTEICKPDCLVATVAAASFLKKKCRLSEPSSNNPLEDNTYLSYGLWSDERAAQLACASTGVGNNQCLMDFQHASRSLGEDQILKSSRGTGPSPNKTAICTNCNSKIYAAFKDAPYVIPSTYLTTVPEPGSVLTKMGKLCGWGGGGNSSGSTPSYQPPRRN